MRDVRRTLLRLALDACDRGDSVGARPLVAAALDMPDTGLGAPMSAPHAECYAAFGRRIDKSARTVRAMVRAGVIPPGAVIGAGRGRRVLVAEALDSLRDQDPLRGESAGAAYVTRRRLHVVGGSS